MRVTLSRLGALQRPATTDLSDLTASVRVGPHYFEPDGMALVINFDPEPTEAEQALIRRRLMTRDAAHEEFVAALLAQVDEMAADTPSARAIRLMAAECLRGINAP